MRPYESEKRPPETGRSAPVNRNSEALRSGNRVGRFTGTSAASASHAKDVKKQRDITKERTGESVTPPAQCKNRERGKAESVEQADWRE